MGSVIEQSDLIILGSTILSKALKPVTEMSAMLHY